MRMGHTEKCVRYAIERAGGIVSFKLIEIIGYKRTLVGIFGFTAATLIASWHCNRHIFASRLIIAGVDIRTVPELMGHQTIQMTMRYSHMAPQHNRAAVDRLVAPAESASNGGNELVTKLAISSKRKSAKQPIESTKALKINRL